MEQFNGVKVWIWDFIARSFLYGFEECSMSWGGLSRFFCWFFGLPKGKKTSSFGYRNVGNRESYISGSAQLARFLGVDLSTCFMVVIHRRILPFGKVR